MVDQPATHRIIRTPDQRLRVFVSSTLQELANERAVAREAIAQSDWNYPLCDEPRCRSARRTPS